MPQFSGMYSGPARREHDAYPTEPTLINAFLDQWGSAIREKLNGRSENTPIRLLDPCAGIDCRWGVMTKEYLQNTCQLETHLTGIELQPYPHPQPLSSDWPVVDQWINMNFLHFTSEQKYDIIISNPPYGPNIEYELTGVPSLVKIPLAEAFIYHGFSLLNANGLMSYLLNLDIQSGQGRYNRLWSTHSPTKSIVCSRRPRFYGNGTSGNNYSIFWWEKDEAGQNLSPPRQWESYLLMHERER